MTAFAQLAAERLAPKRVTVAGYGAVALLLSVNIGSYPLLANGLILLVVLVGVLSFAGRGRVDRIAHYALPLLVSWLLLGWFVGAVPHTVTEGLTWLNDDGRLLVALVPLFFLAIARPRPADIRFFVRMVQWSVWLNLMVFVLALTGLLPRSVGAINGLNYFGLASSHHASGLISGASLIILLASRRWQPGPSITAAVVASGVLLIASGSRTTMIGLAAVGVYVVLSRRRFGQAMRFAVLGLVAAALILLVSAKASSTVAALFSPEFQQQSIAAFFSGMDQEQSRVFVNYSSPLPGYLANIVARFFYFGIAVGLWLKSPLLGIGSFRYNDSNLQFFGWDGVADFAVGGVNGANAINGAHNEYLGLLAENGVLGLVFLLYLWIKLFMASRRRPGLPGPLSASVRAMVVFCLVTAFTGYTLSSPALTFVALTWIALVVTCDFSGMTPARPSPGIGAKVSWRGLGTVRT